MSLYDELGVPKDADKATIRRAYRKRAQKKHPDKGGSIEQFHAIQIAYDVLTDDDRRREYDATGEIGRASDARSDAISQIAAIMMQIIENEDVDETDIKSEIIEAIKRVVASVNRSEAATMQAIEKRERVLKRIKVKRGKANMLAQLVRADIDVKKRSLEVYAKDLAKASLMLEILADYSYEVAEPELLFGKGLPRDWKKYARPV